MLTTFHVKGHDCNTSRASGFDLVQGLTDVGSLFQGLLLRNYLSQDSADGHARGCRLTVLHLSSSNNGNHTGCLRMALLQLQPEQHTGTQGNCENK